MPETQFSVREQALRETRWHYQWIIVHEFLPAVVGDELTADLVTHGARYYEPGEATLIPNFVLVTRYLHMADTLQVQIIPFLASVFSVFLLRQHFRSIPNELADAAKVDGAGHLRFLWGVVLPLSIPVLVTVTLITGLGVYDAFQWPLLVTNSDAVRPVQVGMAQFRTEFGAQYHLEMAAATFVIAPVVVIFLFAQRYLIQGVARTGIRGWGQFVYQDGTSRSG